MAREKTVYDTSEIAHLWAHQAKRYARNKQDNFSFRGTELISYATCIAEIAANRRGEQAAIISTEKYSLTTSGHQYAACAATSHMRRICVPKIAWTHSAQRADFAQKILDAMEEIADARNRISRAKRHEKAQRIVESANEYCSFFDLELFLDIPATDDVIADITARRESEAKQREKLEKKDHRRAMERLRRWKAGETISVYGLLDHYMRINGKEVETTLGAKVPLGHVRKAAPFVLRMIAKGMTYDRDVDMRVVRLGHFRVDRIERDGTVAVGCHRFEKKEVLRIARLLGVTAKK